MGWIYAAPLIIVLVYGLAGKFYVQNENEHRKKQDYIEYLERNQKDD